MEIINPFMHFLPAVVGAYVLYKFCVQAPLSEAPFIIPQYRVEINFTS